MVPGKLSEAVLARLLPARSRDRGVICFDAGTVREQTIYFSKACEDFAALPVTVGLRNRLPTCPTAITGIQDCTEKGRTEVTFVAIG